MLSFCGVLADLKRSARLSFLPSRAMPMMTNNIATAVRTLSMLTMLLFFLAWYLYFCVRGVRV